MAEHFFQPSDPEYSSGSSGRSGSEVEVIQQVVEPAAVSLLFAVGAVVLSAIWCTAVLTRCHWSVRLLTKINALWAMAVSAVFAVLSTAGAG